MKYAAIDIGTNAARLLIGELIEDKGQSSVKKITYLRIPLRLGDDVFEYVLLNKRAEWDEYRKQVSAYELNRYLPVL